MSSRNQAGGRITPRREFLRRAGLAASLPVVGLGTPRLSRAREPDDSQKPQPGALAGLDPDKLVDQVKARNLTALSDSELYRAIAAIVSAPSAEGLTSFTLHAPLEVMARYGLLRLVNPADRELARLQMIASAAAYGAGVKPVGEPGQVKPFPDLTAASGAARSTFAQADAEGTESIVLQIAAQFGRASLVSLLTPLTLPTLTGASHSHIGLWLLLRHGESSSVFDASLLRNAARALAGSPGDQMKSFSSLTATGGGPLATSPGEIEREISAKLANPPKGRVGSQSIRTVIQAGESTGNAESLFGDLIRHDLSRAQLEAAFRAILRVAARSMLQDELRQAKFGWTHCLTLPQSACGLASLSNDPKRGAGRGPGVDHGLPQRTLEARARPGMVSGESQGR